LTPETFHRGQLDDLAAAVVAWMTPSESCGEPVPVSFAAGCLLTVTHPHEARTYCRDHLHREGVFPTDLLRRPLPPLADGPEPRRAA
jgi:hypothetical protein